LSARQARRISGVARPGRRTLGGAVDLEGVEAARADGALRSHAGNVVRPKAVRLIAVTGAARVRKLEAIGPCAEIGAHRPACDARLVAVERGHRVDLIVKRLLLHEGQRVHQPAATVVAPVAIVRGRLAPRRIEPHRTAWRQDVFSEGPDIREVDDGQTKILQLVLTLCPSRGFTHLLHGGHQQANQDGDDGDHDEQFDQCESASPELWQTDLWHTAPPFWSSESKDGIDCKGQKTELKMKLF